MESLAVVSHPSGHSERRAYDALGRVIAQMRLDDAGDEVVYRLVKYDNGDAGRRPSSITTIVPRKLMRPDEVKEVLATEPEELTETFVQVVYYAGTGQELQRRVTAEPDTDGTFRVVVGAWSAYDARGFNHTKGDPYFATSFDYQELSPNQRIASFEFRRDYAGRVIRATRAGGGTRLTQYTSWTVVAWDETDSVTQSKPTRSERYDAWGRLASVEEYTSLGEPVSTFYEFDARGDLKRVFGTDHRCTLSMTHDAVGRRTSLWQVDSGHRAFLLNAGDKAVEVVDPKGNRLVSSFDALNRQLSLTLQSEPDAPVVRRYTYDVDDERSTFCIGRLAKVNDESGEVTLVYDRIGQVIEKTRILTDGQRLQSRTEFDALGNVVGFTYPNQRRVRYRYNRANLLEAVDGVIDCIEYGVHGEVLNRRFSNGVSERMEYDAALRLSAISVSRKSGETFFEQKLSYDQGMRIRQVREHNGDSRVLYYAYDNLCQLRSADGPDGRESFTYDSSANITSGHLGIMKDFEYGDSDHPNRLTTTQSTAGQVEFRYDSAGQLVSRSDLPRLEFDGFGRLTRMLRDDDVAITINYGHGPDRVSKRTEADGVITETLYFDEIYEQSGATSKAHVVAVGSYVAVFIDDASGESALQIHHSDHLGSTRCVTDEVGRVVATQSYGPYGAPVSSLNAATLFIGRGYDNDLKLCFLKTRFYDPATGRFISPDLHIVDDPLSFVYAPRLLNPYAYAANNPLMYRDPNGRFAIFAAVVGVIAGAYLGYRAAEEQGKDPWSGALIGGLIGGLTGGYGGFAALGAAGKSALVSGGFAYASDRENFWTSAAIGFAFGAIGSGIGDWTPVEGSGFWVDVQNIAREVAYDAGLGALQGVAFAAATDEDLGKGFVDGAVKGALMSAAKIAVLGVRYDPISGKDPDGPGLKYEVTHKYGLDSMYHDHSYLAPKIRDSGMPDLVAAKFRRHGLVQLLTGDRSIVLGNNLSLAKGDHYNTSVLAHEIRHIHQQQLMTLGSAEFYARYLLQALFSPAWKHRYQRSPLNSTFETYYAP